MLVRDKSYDNVCKKIVILDEEEADEDNGK